MVFGMIKTLILCLFLTGCMTPCMNNILYEYEQGECEYFVIGLQRVPDDKKDALARYCVKVNGEYFTDENGSYYMNHAICNVKKMQEGFIPTGTTRTPENLKWFQDNPKLLKCLY